MPRNGSGTMSRDNGNFQGSTTWADQAASAPTISSSQHDAHDQDIADEITNSVAVDGQSTMTGNLKMGANKVTGVAAGSSATDAATIGGTETLTNKTITTPKIAQINDTNGNESLIMTATTSAVNELTLANAATGNAPSITASGGDTNIDLNLVAKGSGNVQIGGVDAFAGPILGTEQATTSGTSVNVTGIPSWAKKLTIMLAGVSTNGSNALAIQIGPSGGVETSGYLGSVSNMTTSVSTSAPTTQMSLDNGRAAASVTHGVLELWLEDASNNVWCAKGNFGRSNSATMSICAYSKPLAGALTQFTLLAGGDTFDAGAFNYMYE